jgi:putative spermidine/putrescine transport system permease protein
MPAPLFLYFSSVSAKHPMSTSVQRRIGIWLGIVPFAIFAVAFIFWPAANLFVGAFQQLDGSFTLENIKGLAQPFILEAFSLTIWLSLVTALGGVVLGFLLAYAVVMGGTPQWVRNSLLTFSGVASNFAGVPLAFAFIVTLGRVGIITVLLRDLFGINIYTMGFNLYTFAGLCLTYLYFQFPLMVLIISPALEGLKREWREAAGNLGASQFQYWRLVAFPILLPSLLGAMVLLFGNAFGAYATAYALTGGSLNLVPILIGAQIRGDVLRNPGLGYALALGMVVVMAASIILYSWLQRRASRWVRTGG